MSGIRMIDAKQNRQLHTLLSHLGLMEQKPELIDEATRGRTNSSKGLMYGEARELILKLLEAREQAVGKTRGKIIHLLCLLGMTREDGVPDYARINAYVRGVGKNNPGRKNLLHLSPAEMNKVCTQVEAWYKRELATETDEA